MAIMMAGSKEGNSDGDNGFKQGTATAITRAMAAVTRVPGNEEGEGGKGGKGKGFSNEGGGRQRG